MPSNEAKGIPLLTKVLERYPALSDEAAAESAILLVCRRMLSRHHSDLLRGKPVLDSLRIFTMMPPSSKETSSMSARMR